MARKKNTSLSDESQSSDENSPPVFPDPSFSQDEWELDAEPIIELEIVEETDQKPGAESSPIQSAKPRSAGTASSSSTVSLRPESVEVVPPSPLQIIEAMLFVGGQVLKPELACSTIRGLTHEQFHQLVDELQRRYRKYHRPFLVQPREGGYVLVVRSEFRYIAEKLKGGQREVRLTQPALDVLSVIAYRQPIAKSELDSQRGADSGSLIRQLVRYGVIELLQKSGANRQANYYGTTQRFLDVFGLDSLDDLPRFDSANGP